MKSFQKSVANPTSKLFKKAGGEFNKFFKKGGQFQQGVRSTASALGSTGRILGQGVKAGSQIVGAIESSPYGAALAPFTGVARTALGVGGMASNVGREGAHLLKDVVSGRNAGKITSNVLEKAKNLEKESNKIKFA